MADELCLDFSKYFGEGVVAGATCIDPLNFSNYALHTSYMESDLEIVRRNRAKLLEMTGLPI